MKDNKKDTFTSIRMHTKRTMCVYCNGCNLNHYYLPDWTLTTIYSFGWRSFVNKKERRLYCPECMKKGGYNYARY